MANKNKQKLRWRETDACRTAEPERVRRVWEVGDVRHERLLSLVTKRLGEEEGTKIRRRCGGGTCGGT